MITVIFHVRMNNAMHVVIAHTFLYDSPPHEVSPTRTEEYREGYPYFDLLECKYRMIMVIFNVRMTENAIHVIGSHAFASTQVGT